MGQINYPFADSWDWITEVSAYALEDSVFWASDSSVTESTAYAYRVYSVNGNYRSRSSVRKQICYLSAPSRITLSLKKNRKILIRWTINIRADGYQLQYSTDPNFAKDVVTRIVTDPKSPSLKTFECKENSTYYVRIRAFKQIPKKTCYSEWTQSEKIQIKERYARN